MKPEKYDKKIEELIGRAIGRQRPTFDFDKWQEDHKKEVQIYKAQSKKPSESVKSSEIRRKIMKSPITKLAAAAVLLIGVGYIVGRLSAPRLLDVEQLQANLETSLKSSIEPIIRQDLLEEMNHQWEVSLASNRVQFKAEVRQILIDLIRAIDAVKTQDRRWIVEAMDQIELNRVRDKTQLINGLEALAAGTDTKLLRTKQDIAKLLVYSQLGGVVPEELKSLITSNENERSKE
jgi:hypothetical protein